MILAIDEGTTGVTCLVIDRDGRVRGRAYREFAQHFPRPGWVEHDPEEIWRVVRVVAREAVEAANTTLEALAGLGITNQRETVVMWDRASGEPIGTAIVWQDRRTAQRCAELAPRAAEIRDRTGLVVDPYFSATKIEWLLEHVPALERRMRAGDAVFGTVDAWLIARLTTGRSFATDHTNASRTMLYDIARHRWDPDLLALFGVAADALPEVRASGGEFGVCDAEYFGAAIPITGVAGDQQAALFGQGCWTAGSAKNTYGTGAFLLLNTGPARAESQRGLLTTVACGPAGEPVFALEGSVFIAGAAVQWLRDGLGLFQNSMDIEALAASVPDSGGVVFVPALTGLGAPHWRSEARGAIFGITRGTTAAHLARATLEGIALQIGDLVAAMTADRGQPPGLLKVDGGAARNNLLMQLQADLTGIPVVRPQTVETTALGAAMLAGLAVGFWRDLDEVKASWREERRFLRQRPPAWREELLARWRQAVEKA